jgi:rubrerythrin
MEPSAAAAVGTMDNLQAAFHGESNAHARYLAFAVKADEEGYGKVASLFRAAARAEKIHAENHAAVIRLLRAEPLAIVETPDVKSTRENLKAAIRGETYERDEMYPAFIARAEAEEVRPAVNTFRLALEVEAEHERLYSRSLNALEEMRGAGAVYLVCPVCGFTAAKPEFEACPVCSTAVEDFEEIR